MALGSTTIGAQTSVTTEPARPTAGTSVTIVLTTQCGCPGHFPELGFVRNGFTFDIPHADYCLGTCSPGEVVRYNVGPLEPGLYTVRHAPIGDPSDFAVIGTFLVLEPAIPVLNITAMAAMALALAAFAAIVLRR